MQEIWDGVEETQPGGDQSQPLTFTRFLECLDTAKSEYNRCTRATINTKTLMFLMDDVNTCSICFGRSPGPVQIYGVPIEADESLPDNAIKIDGRMYNNE